MKIKKGFVLRPLGNEHLVIGEGAACVNFNKIVTLNHSAAYLWNSLSEMDFTPETMATLLVEKYTVDWERALGDSKALFESWQKAGLLE